MIILKELEVDDYLSWYQGFNNRLDKQLPYDEGKLDMEPCTKSWFVKLVEYHQTLRKCDEQYIYGIFRKEDGKHLGMIYLAKLVRDRTSWAEIGYFIHNQYFQKGYGKAALKSLLKINREELPKKIDSEVLKEKLALINKRLSEPTKKQEKEIQKLQNEHLPRLEKYENDLRVMGDRNSYSKTDIDATFMRMKDDHMQNGQLKPAYNTQISTENQFITHISIHQTPGDTTTLEEHLNSFEQQYQKQSKEVCADAGYGSEENYEMLENKGVVSYVKYNYFHKEQKKKQKENPFLPQNMFYNSKEDYYVCPMGQKMTNVGIGKRSSSNGYESEVAYYQAQRCEGCPLRALCHKSKGNRKIEVNYRLNELKSQAKKLLNSERGHYHRSKRPIEVEAVFGQLKNNNKFNRFTFRGLEKVEMEFLLMALGHNFRKWSSRQANSTQKTSKSAIFTSNFCSNIAFINYILPKPDEILKKSRYLNPIKIAA